MSIKGTAKGSSPLQEATKTFIITLVDPCDPPISVTGTDFTNQEYTLTDNQKEYTHPAFTVSPGYCPIVYTITETLLTAGDSAIVNDITGTKTDVTTFQYHYDKDLAPLGQTQTITVTAKSTSKYGVNNPTEVKEDSRSFILSFKNPCIDTSFVMIVAPTNILE